MTLEQAREQMKGIAAQIEQAYPKSNQGWGVTVDRYEDRVVDKDLRQSLLVLLAAVGAVLLIGCVNLANLLLVRGAGREREVAVRSALGAGRWRLVRQFLTESILLAGTGGVVGVALGWGFMLGLKAWIPPFLLPAEANVSLNGEVLLFAAAIVVTAGILFGVAPALQSMKADLVGSLKEGGRGGTTGINRTYLRNGLAVAEIALAFILLSGAGLLIRSFYQLQQVDAGFDTTNVIAMGFPMTTEQYPDGPHIIRYLGQVMERIQAVPGVREVATTGTLPLEGWPDGMPFLIEGQPFVEVAKRPAAGFKPVSPSYLSAIGMRLKKGRWLAETDTGGTVPVTVVNEAMVKKYFKNEEPLGKHIRIEEIIPGQPALGPEIAWEVVGVVEGEKACGLDDACAGLYVSYKQSPSPQQSLVVRGAMDPNHLVKSIETAVWELNKEQALDRIRPLEQIKSESLGENRTRTILLGTFAGLALLLSAIGVYGVISYSVSQRTHEIGIRAALGARAWEQLTLVLKTGMALTGAGTGGGSTGGAGADEDIVELFVWSKPAGPVDAVDGGSSVGGSGGCGVLHTCIPGDESGSVGGVAARVKAETQ